MMRGTARPGVPARPEAGRFTLVELLVVIAILTLLASLLLPVMKRAMESSRRVVCKSNAKQLYACLVVYSEDQNGFLPNSKGWYNNLANADLTSEYFYTDSNKLPFLNFFATYVGVKIAHHVANNGPHYFAFPSASEKSILFCPSRSGWVTYSPQWWTKDVYFGSKYAYYFSGIGFFSEVTDPVNFQLYGGPRLENMGGPAGPVSLLSEVYTNHAGVGLHALSEKGECQWTDFPDMRVDQGTSWAKNFYFPHVWGGPNLALWRPPTGGLWDNTTGTQPQERRRIFGYAR